MSAVTEVEEALRSLAGRLQAESDQRVKLVVACTLVLLFHSGSPWDDAKKEAWADGLKVLNLSVTDATTKNLCDAVRVALEIQTP